MGYMSLTISDNTNFIKEKQEEIDGLKKLSDDIQKTFISNIKKGVFTINPADSSAIIDVMSELKNMVLDKIKEERRSSLIDILFLYFDNYFKLLKSVKGNKMDEED